MQSLQKFLLTLVVAAISTFFVACEYDQDAVLPANIQNQTVQQTEVSSQDNIISGNSLIAGNIITPDRSLIPNAACPLVGAWNGQYGAENACSDIPSDCFECSEPGSDIYLKVQKAFKLGVEPVRKLFFNEKWESYFPGMDEETVRIILENDIVIIPDDNHYVILLDGETILSINF